MFVLNTNVVFYSSPLPKLLTYIFIERTCEIQLWKTSKNKTIESLVVIEEMREDAVRCSKVGAMIATERLEVDAVSAVNALGL